MNRYIRADADRGSIRRAVLAIIGFVALMGLLTLLVGKPLLAFIDDPERFRAWVDARGILARIVFVLMVFLQVIVALVPGEPLEIAAGYAFGFVEGTVLCIAGITLASAVVFLFVKRFGIRLVRIFFSEEQIASVRFLHDRKRLFIVTAILFLIPGTPKDVMTYCVGLTDMKLPSWLLIAAFARIPSIVTSTAGGDALGGQDYRFALFAFLLAAILALIGTLVYRRFSNRKK